jgi:hypothetical protein
MPPSLFADNDDSDDGMQSSDVFNVTRPQGELQTPFSAMQPDVSEPSKDMRMLTTTTTMPPPSPSPQRRRPPLPQ